MPPVYDALVGPLMRSFGLSRRRTGPDKGNVFASKPRVYGGPARYGRVPVSAAALAALTGAAALALTGRRRLKRRPAA
jgi:hypothetical protein